MSRVESFDKINLKRTVLPPSCLHIEFDDGDYEQKENAEPKLPNCKKQARRRVNRLINGTAGVDGDASGNTIIKNKNNDFAKFIIVNDIKL